MEITPVHERWHAPSEDATPDWSEGHRLELVGGEADGAAVGLAIVVEMRRFPGQRRTTVRLAVLERNELPIVLVDVEVPSPKPANTWEVRGTGIWCEMVCETPLVHWSYGLEAFALALDQPRDLLESGLGHRVPLGWELEFEQRGPATWVDQACYVQAGHGHGLLLSADGERAVEGVARRWHWWGLGEPFLGAAPIGDDDDGAGEHPIGEAGVWLDHPLEHVVLGESGLSVFRNPPA